MGQHQKNMGRISHLTLGHSFPSLANRWQQQDDLSDVNVPRKLAHCGAVSRFLVPKDGFRGKSIQETTVYLL